MNDKILGVIEDCKCPICGSKNIICYVQFPLSVTMDMNGDVVRINTQNKKIMKPNNKWKLEQFDYAMLDYQLAQYNCLECDWLSNIYAP